MLASVHSDEPVQPPFKLRNSKCCSVSSFIFIDIQALIGLLGRRICAGWSEPLLVAHSTLLKISCPGSCSFTISVSANFVEISDGKIEWR